MPIKPDSSVSEERDCDTFYYKQQVGLTAFMNKETHSFVWILTGTNLTVYNLHEMEKNLCA